MRLREKGGKAHAISCHHSLEDYLTAYLKQTGSGRDRIYWQTLVCAGLDSYASGIMTLRRS